MLVTLRGQRVTLNILFFQQGQVPDISLNKYFTCVIHHKLRNYFFFKLDKKINGCLECFYVLTLSFTLILSIGSTGESESNRMFATFK